MKPIFLDFMCPDAWKTYITIPQHLNEVQTQKLVTDLKRSINLSVLLSESYCILPPAFILQSDVVYNVIYELRRFLEYREIFMPLKELSVDDYITKKMSEYRYVKKNYQGFYKRAAAENFLNEYRYSIIRRSASMGSSIATKWIDLPDKSPIWKPIIDSLPEKADKVRLAPSNLNSRGISITLEAILKQEKIPPLGNVRFAINQAIQYEYIGGYLQEYNATIISNIPPKPVQLNFGINIESNYFNYLYISQILRKIGGNTLIEVLGDASPDEICELKNLSDFLYVRSCYHQNCAKDIQFIFRLIECVQENMKPKKVCTLNSFVEFLKRISDIIGKNTSNACYISGEKKFMVAGKKTLFVSYKAEDTPIANIIVDAIQAKAGDKIEISRYSDLEYKASFKQFMNSIEEHDYVMCIVSDKYLKSRPCMYEVGETIKSHNFSQKLLHIVLKDEDAKNYADPKDFSPADIFTSKGRLSYTSYWKKAYDELHADIVNINDVEATRSEAQILNEIGHILRDDIQVFLDYLCNSNAKTFEELRVNDFQEVIKAMGV